MTYFIVVLFIALSLTVGLNDDKTIKPRCVLDLYLINGLPAFSLDRAPFGPLIRHEKVNRIPEYVKRLAEFSRITLFSINYWRLNDRKRCFCGVKVKSFSLRDPQIFCYFLWNKFVWAQKTPKQYFINKTSSIFTNIRKYCKTTKRNLNANEKDRLRDREMDKKFHIWDN